MLLMNVRSSFLTCLRIDLRPEWVLVYALTKCKKVYLSLKLSLSDYSPHRHESI